MFRLRLSLEAFRYTGKRLIRPTSQFPAGNLLSNVIRTKNFNTLANGMNPTVLARVSQSYAFASGEQRRYKKRPQKGKRAQEQDEEEDSDEESESDSDSDDEELSTGDYADRTAEVNSMRFDVVAKAVFGGTRNKVDSMFLEDRYRVDNERISKKSQEISEGQTIDLIAGRNKENENMLNIHRAIIREVPDKCDSKGRITFKFRRYKPMVIENYEDYPYESMTVAPDDAK